MSDWRRQLIDQLVLVAHRIIGAKFAGTDIDIPTVQPQFPLANPSICPKSANVRQST